MISQEQAEALKREYRPLFSSDDVFQANWDRAWDKLHRPELPALRRWLDGDLEEDRARAAGSIRPPALPVQQTYSPVPCYHCNSRGYVVKENHNPREKATDNHLDPGQPDFGQAVVCRACDAGRRKCLCVKCTSLVPNGNHALCVDETGHDFNHPEFCPRCLEAKAKNPKFPMYQPLGQPVADPVGMLAGTFRIRRTNDR